MLISLRINNCFAFNKEVEFSMHANMHYKNFPSNVKSEGNNNILKTAMIIGPNNSGKTNFINVIRVAKSIMLNQAEKLVKNLFTNEPISIIEITFTVNNKEYQFEVRFNSLTQEYVYERFSNVTHDRYNNIKVVDWLVRDYENNRFKCDNAELESAMAYSAKNNILIYLLDTNRFQTLGNIKKILTSFASQIDVIDMNNIPIAKTISMLKMPSEAQKKIVNFIINADLCMDDFKYAGEDEFKKLFQINETNGMKPQEKALSEAAPLMELLHLLSVYKGITMPSLLYDSTGTKKIVSIASYVIDALESGRILVVDELDNSLHFKLTRAIIALFNNDLNDKAQLICTVHDVSLLDCQKLFRKEQIWFTYKDRDNAYIYSLADFTSEKDKIRDTTDIIEKYKQGVFGALPDPDLFQSLLEVRGYGIQNSAD